MVNFVVMGIVDDLLKLARLYNGARPWNNEVTLCLDGICKLFNKLTGSGKLVSSQTILNLLS